jgi:hypothetical protein
MSTAKPRNAAPRPQHARSGLRIQSLRDISLNYEGHSERLEIRPPDLSSRGMFITTSRRFPEGAVLNLSFRLVLSGAEIRARGEVRYCLPGVGVGVEFIDLPPLAAAEIEREVELCEKLLESTAPRRAK